MVKRKRAKDAEAERDVKVQRFITKLAKSLFDTARGPLQEDTVAAAFKEAIAKLPEGNLLRQKLQQDLQGNTQLLLQEFTAIQPQPVVVDSQQEQPPSLTSPGAKCLSELCHRSCQTDQDKIARCQHILAACVNVIPSGVVQRESGLSVCLDAIRSTLQDVCNASNAMESRAAKANSLQPLIAQLKCVVMMGQMRKDNSSQQTYVSPDELQQTGAETVLMAAEQRILADQHFDSQQQVRLAASDIHNLTDDQSGVILNLLLQDSQPCTSPDSKTAALLWEIFYKATLQQSHLKPKDEDFLLRIAATQKARSVLPASQRSGLAEFDSKPAPASFIAWLQKQPRSQAVTQCLNALEQSPLHLTQHLLASNKVNVLLALSDSANAVTPQPDEAAAQTSPLASDEGLFYVDEAGDSAFGRKWDTKAADAVDDEEVPGDSLEIDNLPGSSKPQLTGSSDESE